MKKITNITLHMVGIVLAFTLINLAITGCNHEPVGDDSIRLRAFLEVSYPEDSWGINSPPAAKVVNTGPDAVEINFFRFTLVADGDVDMEVPENCGLMYEDMVDEMLLIVHCDDIVLEQNEELVMNFPLTGPWHMLELTSISAWSGESEVYNDISADHPMMWFK
jgi:hypothetical protein